MSRGDYVPVFVHDVNVSWWDAVESPASLQCTLNRSCADHESSHYSTPVHVVLFTWPSDGRIIPYWSYFSDHSDAETSGYAFGRGAHRSIGRAAPSFCVLALLFFTIGKLRNA